MFSHWLLYEINHSRLYHQHTCYKDYLLEMIHSDVINIPDVHSPVTYLGVDN